MARIPARLTTLTRATKLGLAAIGLSTLSSISVAGTTIEVGSTSISIGAGMRVVAKMTEDSAPNGDSSSNFDVENMRLYFGAKITDTVKFTFNTDEIFGDGPVDVLDAIAQFEFNPAFNLWVGRMLTPADRIEMNGPFYGLTWNQYTQPLYASDQGGAAGTYGRDDGMTVWGSQGKFQYALGAFDGIQGFGNHEDNVLWAGRFAYNFLNMEQNPAYYTSSTYHGGLGNIFTVGLSFQSQDGGVGNTTRSGDFSGYTVDVLSETVMGGGGVLTIEAEYKDFEADYTPATGPVGGNCFCLFDGDSYFASIAYLIPGSGTGKFQPYLRYVDNSPNDAAATDLTEVGINYVISGHNARLNLNYSSGDANISGYPGKDVDSVSFGAQLQF
jgi:hypothetical protein